MNYIWVLLLVFSFVCAVLTGKMGEFSDGIIQSGTDAVKLIITLLGTFVFWSGIMNVAEKSGFTDKISAVLSPALKRLFPSVKPDTRKAISMNITANLLGIGNAATPLGIEAMKRLSEENGGKDTASNNMILFVVMNTAAMHILPTTVALLRKEYGAENPMDIFVPAILTSMCALFVGITLVKIIEKIGAR